MKILGVDPGTTRIGYGLVEGVRTPKLVRYGVIEITSPKGPHRLLELAERFDALLEELKPDRAGVEELFFAKNQKTALPVAEARGVIMTSLLKRGIPIVEWRPAAVKLAITSYGFADKKAVASMVARILGVSELTGYDDASDALAIALATAFREADPRGKTSV